jgi:uncharacterized protein (TIGR02597 family)
MKLTGLPLQFEVNRGQADPAAPFLARGAGYALFLAPSEASLVLHQREPARAADDRAFPSARTPAKPGKMAAVRMRLLGANPRAAMTGREPMPGRVHYLRGADPAEWLTDVAAFGRVRIEEVYPGVALEYYGRGRQLEYDFIVAPQADPEVIRWRFEGIERLEVNAAGDLLVFTPLGAIRQQRPLLYQEIEGARREVAGRYALHNGCEVSFEIAGYDRSRTLVIDPVLGFSTALGGGGDEQGSAIAMDAAGSVYVTGFTESLDYPTTVGALDGGISGVLDAFVTKLTPSGGAVVYSTYLGGSGEEQGFSIAVDSAGQAYVTGFTDSNDFPTTSGAFDRTFGGLMDAFVAKLNANGSALLYSTFLGGSEFEIGLGIALDAQRHAYVTGETDSSNFPKTTGALDATLGGSSDAFVTKLSTNGSALVYSTYLGGALTNAAGSARECGCAIAVHGSNAFVAGFTDAVDFPATPGAFDSTLSGATDAFVAQLNSAGNALVYATHLGGSHSLFTGGIAGADYASAIAVDNDGNAYLAGETYCTNFPTTVGAHQTSPRGVIDGFVTKLGANGLPAYSTLLGGTADEKAYAVVVDEEGNAHVTGKTTSINFPVTSDAFQDTLGGNADAFVATLDAGGSNLLHATYLGGSSDEQGMGLALDSSGNLALVGETESADFPFTPQAAGTNFFGVRDAFVAKLFSGVARFDVLAGSDAPISVPFHREPVYTGEVAGVFSNTILVTGAPFAGGEYAGRHYARFASGDADGFWSTIASHTDNTLTLADASVAARVTVGDMFRVQPHQTLDSVFPAALEGVAFVKSPSASIRKTEVLFFDAATVGINKSAVASYYYINQGGTNVGWRLVGPSPASTTDAGPTVIPPDTYLVLRNKNNPVALRYQTTGRIEFGALARSLPTHAVQNDLYAVSGRAVTITLRELNLGGTAAFQSSPSGSIRKDQVLVFDNNVPGQNQSAAATYYYISQGGTNVGWRLVGPAPASTTEVGHVPVIVPGSGFLIRKSAGASATNDWRAASPY